MSSCRFPILLLSLLLWSTSATAIEPTLSLAVPDDLLVPGSVLLLGEVHGTIEGPAFVGELAERVTAEDRGLTVALEIWREEKDRIEIFMSSDGGHDARAALLLGPFWRVAAQDGRQSQAMIQLLETCRRLVAQGRRVRVRLLDSFGSSGNAREETLAEELAGAASEGRQDLVVALVGNAHARLGRGGALGVSDPMSIRFARRSPETVLYALELIHAGGEAWLCTSEGCGPTLLSGSKGPPFEASDRPSASGYHGFVHLGGIHASPPAVAELRAPRWARDQVANRLFQPTWPVSEPETGASEAFEPIAPLGEWPQWMGPKGDGSLEIGLLKSSLELRLAVDWRRQIGDGFASVSIAEGLGVTLETDAQGSWVVAIDPLSGHIVWRSLLATESTDPPNNLDALSTPTLHGGSVFAVHARAHLFALDDVDGSIRWHRDLAAELGASPPSHGMATSPIVVDERLFLLVGGTEGRTLVAFALEDGRVLDAFDLGTGSSYATPVVGSSGADRWLVVPAPDRISALSLDSLEQRWSLTDAPFPDRNPLIVDSDLLFMAFQEHAAMYSIGAAKAEERWRSQAMRASYSPAVFHDDAIFGFGPTGLVCLDSASGRVLWQDRSGSGTLIRVDEHLVVFGTRSGRVRLVEASSKAYREVTSLQIRDPGDHGPTPPSFAAGRIYWRSGSEIAALRVGIRRKTR